MKRMGSLVAAGITAAFILSGCSSISGGGDTKCKDFTTQDEKDQTSAVAEMLKDEKGTDASNIEISATRLSAQAFCQTVGKQDSTIKEAPHL